MSTNQEPSFDEFEKLVVTATEKLNEDAKNNTSCYSKLTPQGLENKVEEFLNKAAKDTEFEGKIEKIAGQRFPDIVVGKIYGVEVKSSKNENWITLGGSVNESTRDKDVKHIFLIFGKLGKTIEFKSRLHEDCISEVVVTHYPRYKIDMKLKSGETFFDKMGKSYDELRSSGNHISMIVNYYKSQLKDGESLWWTGETINDEPPKEIPTKIRLFNTLSERKKEILTGMALALFPELTGNSSTKYARFSFWLLESYGIVSTSTRDLFSAGGKGCIKSTEKTYNDVPRIILNIKKYKDCIIKTIKNTEEGVLCEKWNVTKIETDRLGQWMELISKECSYKEIKTVMKIIFDR